MMLQSMHRSNAAPSIRSAAASTRPCLNLAPGLHSSSPGYVPVTQASSGLRGVATGASATEPLQAAPAPTPEDSSATPTAPMRVLIAGGGIGGLVCAVSMLKKGLDVQVFERDLTAIRGEGKYRGPIQIQSNALAALEAIDYDMAQEIMANGCVTGDRINGLCDGKTGEWYCKFDTYHPAVSNGLPVTRVVSRVALQEILAKYAIKYGKPDTILNDTQIVSYTEDNNGSVSVQTKAGETYKGDLLIGADGIWSKVREQLIGPTQPSYSQYTCYTGIADFLPADIDTVGYRVFLGNRQYFVSSDVGGGKMQWYGFHKEEANGKDEPGCSKQRLIEIFGGWCDEVVDLIKATAEDDVIRRDIYDRPPIFKWTEGRVALLGDSAHAMQPNLGQGGCMAIEDGYALARLLDSEMCATEQRLGRPAVADDLNVPRVLSTYQSERLVRASAIHGMAGMAAFMASTYKTFLGEALPYPLSEIERLKIPHPGKVAGYVAMQLTMPQVLGWVLGGNADKLKTVDRVRYCNLDDAPDAFSEADFPLFMNDDKALIRAAGATWMMVPVADVRQDLSSAAAFQGGVAIGDGLALGSGSECGMVADGDGVSDKHATVEQRGGDYFIHAAAGLKVNDRKLSAGEQLQIFPGDVVVLGDASAFKVKLRHSSLAEE